MIYFAGLIIFLLILLIIRMFGSAEKRLLKTIRAQWGKPVDKFRGFGAIERYADVDTAVHYHTLSGQTLADIDSWNLFTLLDRTDTTIGQQYLYHQLVHPTDDISVLKERDQQAEFFKTNSAVRESTQVILKRMEMNGTAGVVNFLTDEPLVEQKHRKKFKVLSAVTLVLFISAFFYGPAAILFLMLIAFNISLYYVLRYNNLGKVKTIGEVYDLLKSVKQLLKLELPVEKKPAAMAVKSMGGFERAYRLLNFGVPHDEFSKIIFAFFEMLKSSFLVEIHLLYRSADILSGQKKAIEELFKFAGKTDSLISTASLKSDESLQLCLPGFTKDKKEVLIKNARHPLLENCVPNSIHLYNKSAFITGSNMSGKSTFLRTILINSILAQTMYFCFAEEFNIAICRQFSSIKIGDNLEEGKSYYFTEVGIINEMMKELEAGGTSIFIIDEIFKGTNTIERIALAQAILHYLDTDKNIVIASSHDLELIEMLSPGFAMFHFAESIVDDSLQFDHTIKEGPLKTRNAIRITEIEGYPARVVADAYQYAARMQGKKD